MEIEGHAFSHCVSLTDINIPSSITHIGSCVFTSCNSLKSITVANGNAMYHSAGNCIIQTASKSIISGCNTSVIPTDGSVTQIQEFAFGFLEGIDHITIPDSVTFIAYYAFLVVLR